MPLQGDNARLQQMLDVQLDGEPSVPTARQELPDFSKLAPPVCVQKDRARLQVSCTGVPSGSHCSDGDCLQQRSTMENLGPPPWASVKLCTKTFFVTEWQGICNRVPCVRVYGEFLW